MSAVAHASADFHQEYEVRGNPIARGRYGRLYRCYLTLQEKMQRRDFKSQPASELCVKVIKSSGKAPLEDEVKNCIALRSAMTSASATASARHLMVPLRTYRDADRIYMVMEYAGGGTLTKAILKLNEAREDAATRMELAIRWTRQILQGLQFLHGCGMMHNDLKPDNVVLTSGDFSTAEVRIVDFGFSKGRTEESALPAGGTLAYMAPERQEGQCGCFLADVYAVGCIAFEVLTGRQFYSHLPTSAAPWELYVVDGEALGFIRALTVSQFKVVNGRTISTPLGRMEVSAALGHTWLRDRQPACLDQLNPEPTDAPPNDVREDSDFSTPSTTCANFINRQKSDTDTSAVTTRPFEVVTDSAWLLLRSDGMSCHNDDLQKSRESSYMVSEFVHYGSSAARMDYSGEVGLTPTMFRRKDDLYDVVTRAGSFQSLFAAILDDDVARLEVSCKKTFSLTLSLVDGHNADDWVPSESALHDNAGREDSSSWQRVDVEKNGPCSDRDPFSHDSAAGISPMMLACAAGNELAVTCMMAFVGRPPSCSTTEAAWLAVAFGNGAVAETILQRFPPAMTSPEALTGEIVAALEDSSQNGRLVDDRFAPLHWACRGQTRVVAWLLNLWPVGAKTSSESGCTPLHCASENGHNEAIELLLRIDPEGARKRDNLGRIAAHYAAKNGRVNALELLLRSHPNGSMDLTWHGHTPFHYAAENGHRDALESLLRANSEGAKKGDKSGLTPVHHAAKNGHVGALEVLLHGHPDRAQFTTRFGQTPLHYAAENGHRDAVEMLLRVSPEAAKNVDKSGSTPVHYAAKNGHLHALELLLRVRPEGSRDTDNQGHTPAYFAEKNRHHDVLERLRTVDDTNNRFPPDDERLASVE